MGLFKKIFGSKDKSTDSTMTFQQAADIAGAYGDVLVSIVPGAIADASKLPHSKPIIKQALITLLKTNKDPQMIEHLKSSYWLLADWQDGVGQTNIGFDPSSIDITADPVELAKQLSAQSGNKEWTEKADKERQQLRAELGDLGYL